MRKWQSSKNDPGKNCAQCGNWFKKRNPARTQESKFCGYSCSAKSKAHFVIPMMNTAEANLKKSQKLEKHPKWISSRKTKSRPRPESQAFKRAVLERDGNKCTWCGSTDKLVADHIKPYALYEELRFDPKNGRTLCEPCHRKTDTYGRKTKMPFRSKSQARKIAQLEKEGKVKKGTTQKWASETSSKLPERVTPNRRPTTIKQIEEIRVKKYGK